MPTLGAPPPIQGDNTDMLNAWFDKLPVYTEAIFDPANLYYCEHVVSLLGKVGLIVRYPSLRRYGHHPRKPSGHEDNVAVEHLNLRSCLGIQIIGADIQGPKTPDQGYSNAQEGQAGIGIHGSDGVTVAECHITHVHGDAVWLVSRGQHRPTNIEIVDNTGGDFGRDSICVEACDNGKFFRNTLPGPQRYGLHFERSRRGDGWTNITHGDNVFTKAVKP